MENKIFEEKEQKNNKNTPGAAATFILLSAFYVFSCVYLPTSTLANLGVWLSAVLALGVCVAAVLAIIRMSGSVHPILGYIIIVGAFLLLGGAFLPLSLLVSFVSGTVVYSYLLSEKRSAAVFGLPLVAALLAMLITRSPMGIALSLCSLPASVMLFFAIKNKVSRVGAVCRISFGIVLSVLAFLGLYIYITLGELSAETIKSLINFAKEQLTLLLSDMLAEIGELVGELFVSLETESLISLMVSTVFNLLPAMIITLANIAAYIIHSLYISSQYSASRESRKEALPMLTFDMSIFSAVIYIISAVLSFTLTAGSAAIYGTVAQNLLLILVPGLVLTALAYIRSFSISRGPSCLGTLLYFGVIFLVVGLNPIVLAFVASVGAVFIIVSHIARYRKEHGKE